MCLVLDEAHTWIFENSKQSEAAQTIRPEQ